MSYQISNQRNIAMTVSLGFNRSRSDGKKVLAQYDYLMRNDNSLYHEMSEADSTTLLKFNELIAKLTAENGWLIDFGYEDGRFKFAGMNYRHTASRYFDVDGSLVTCSVELLLNPTGNLVALNRGVISVQGDGLMYADFSKPFSLDDINNSSIDELIAHIHSTMNILLDSLQAETVTEFDPHSIHEQALGFKGMGSITMMYIDRSTDDTKRIESYCFDNYRIRQRRKAKAIAAA